MVDTQDVLSWRGEKVIDVSGEKIGKVEEIYLDRDTDKPEWALVNTGLFGTKSSFVPLEGATREAEGVRVPFDKEKVKGAPSIASDQELSQEEEAELYSYYGVDYGENRSDTGLPEGGTDTSTEYRDTTDYRDTSTTDYTDTDESRTTDRGVVGRDVDGRETDEAMTRSEEELRIDKTQREAGVARLRKHVTTEQVNTTVPVQREEVRVEREPITDANVGSATEGPAISEEEHEVTLMEEDVDVDKRAVPKERIRLDKDTVTEERTVSDEVRKEQIDVDSAGTTTREDDDLRR